LEDITIVKAKDQRRVNSKISIFEKGARFLLLGFILYFLFKKFCSGRKKYKNVKELFKNRLKYV